MIRISAFRWAPPFAQGLVRDLRVRWALEEAGLPHEVRLIDPEIQKSDEYRKQQPFGQVPVLQDGDLTLFESGSIVLYVAEKSKTMLPADEAGRARVRTWVIASLNTIEPHISNLMAIDLFNKDKDWAAERRPEVLKSLKGRLSELDQWLNGREYLEGNSFTAADLMMTAVLRILRLDEMLDKEFPRLRAFVTKHEQRPAFKKALDAQMKPFAENAPS